MHTIAILVEKEFQDLEVFYPYYRFKEEGYKVLVLGTGTAARYTGKYGFSIAVDGNVGDYDAGDFSAVLIPGGWAPDHMRWHPEITAFVRAIDRDRKVVASICHGGWVLASADIVRGRKVTAYKAIRDDMIHAGGLFVDEEVVIDKNLITSRTPDDLPAFCKAVIAALKAE